MVINLFFNNFLLAFHWCDITIFVVVLRKYSNLHFNVNKRTCFDLTDRGYSARRVSSRFPKGNIKSIKGGGCARSAMLAGFELQRWCVRLDLSFYLIDFNRTGLIFFVFFGQKSVFRLGRCVFVFFSNFYFLKIYFCFFSKMGLRYFNRICIIRKRIKNLYLKKKISSYHGSFVINKNVFFLKSL